MGDPLYGSQSLMGEGAQNTPESDAQDSQEAVGPEQPGSIVRLIQTRQWLKTQLLEYNTQLTAAKNNKALGESSDPETTISRISKLQKELQDTATDLQLKDLMLHRLQVGNRLMSTLFPTEDGTGAGDVTSQPSKQQQETILRLLDKQTTLSSEILRVHKLKETIRPSVETVKRSNLGLKQANRELMYTLQKERDAQENRFQDVSQQSEVKKFQAKLKDSLDKVVLVRHILQALILGSGVHWVQDEGLTQLLLSLGRPLEDVLDDVQIPAKT